MAKTNKYVHFNTRAAFDTKCPNPSAAEGNEFYNYTVFIKDTGEIYTHGRFYGKDYVNEVAYPYYLPIELSEIIDSAENNSTFDFDEDAYNALRTAIEDSRPIAVGNYEYGSGISFAVNQYVDDLVYLTFVANITASAIPRFFAVEITSVSGYAKEIKYSEGIVNISWLQLCSNRTNGILSAGTKYRITDYVTTTTVDNTMAADHQFDIIVTALDNHTLSEEASVCLHDGDTYFSATNSKLEAWKIWYCLDNDVNRFEWADTANGRGVIYRMIDEHGNDCPYDFKNIKFYIADDIHIDAFDGVGYYYTFAYDSTDGSICTTCVCNNIIKPFKIEDFQYLNNNIFLLNDNHMEALENTLEYNCHHNIFGSAVGNVIGCNCEGNIFGNVLVGNNIGWDSSYNIIHGEMCNNIIGHEFAGNTINSSYMAHNTIGNQVTNNLFNSNQFVYNNILNSVALVDIIGENLFRYYISSMQGTDSEHIVLNLTGDLDYETKVSKNSTGEIKIYCEADLIA